MRLGNIPTPPATGWGVRDGEGISSGKGWERAAQGGLESLFLEEFQGIPGFGRNPGEDQAQLGICDLGELFQPQEFWDSVPLSRVWNAGDSSEGQTLHELGMGTFPGAAFHGIPRIIGNELHSMEYQD